MVQGSGLKVLGRAKRQSRLHGYDARREVDGEVSGGDWFHRDQSAESVEA